MKIGIIGLGKVGLPLALVMAKRFKVQGVDISSERLCSIQNREDSIEANVNEYLELYGDNLDISMDLSSLVNCDIIFIVVGTQSEGYSPTNVKLTLKDLAPDLTHGEQILVIVSTVNPTDIDRELVPFLDRLRLRTKLEGICYNPAMIALGNAIKGFERPDFVLIGESNSAAGNKLGDVWKKIVPSNTPIIHSSIVNVETAKFALNLALVNKITIINTITQFCEAVGADIDFITDILKLEPRISGKKMFKGGLGFGGPCFPDDVVAFKKVSEKFGLPTYLCDAMQQVNMEQISRSVKLIEGFHKKRIGFLGITYKPRTSLTIGSQALQIAHELERKGYGVAVYDPSGMENAKQELKKVKFTDSMKQCIRGSEILFIGVPWSEFFEIEPKDFGEAQIVIDPWRVLRDKELSCRYIAYGLKWR